MDKQKLPHAQSALILGISSIVTACCCYGIIGAILGVIGLIQANKAIAIFTENSDQYETVSNAKTGKVTSIIGIVLGLLIAIAYGIFVAIFGFATNPEDIQEILNAL